MVWADVCTTAAACIPGSLPIENVVRLREGLPHPESRFEYRKDHQCRHEERPVSATVELIGGGEINQSAKPNLEQLQARLVLERRREIPNDRISEKAQHCPVQYPVGWRGLLAENGIAGPKTGKQNGKREGWREQDRVDTSERNDGPKNNQRHDGH